MPFGGIPFAKGGTAPKWLMSPRRFAERSGAEPTREEVP
jgi:hypothetical protein